MDGDDILGTGIDSGGGVANTIDNVDGYFILTFIKSHGKIYRICEPHRWRRVSG